METETPSAADLANSLEKLSRRLHSQGYAASMFPAQWVALRYIHSADVGFRTASELARYQGLAPGAVARTVRTLIDKGLVCKAGPIGSGRAQQLDLTERGRTVLRKDPLARISRAFDGLAAAERRQLASVLQKAIETTGRR